MRAVHRGTLLFFDAACLIAAAGSPAGGSGFLLSLCRRGLLLGAVSDLVLLEAERNIRDKLPLAALLRFRTLVRDVPLQIVVLQDTDARQQFQHLVNGKDAHVVAAAVGVDAAYLVTLDQRLLVEVNGAGLSLQAITPGAFITALLPAHPDHGHVRDE